MNPRAFVPAEQLLSLAETISDLYSWILLQEHGYEVSFAVDFSEMFAFLFPDVVIAQASREPDTFLSDEVALGFLFSGNLVKDPASLILLPPYIVEMEDHRRMQRLDYLRLEMLTEKQLQILVEDFRKRVMPAIESQKTSGAARSREALAEARGAFAGLYNALTVCSGESKHAWGIAAGFFKDKTLRTIETFIEDGTLSLDWDSVGRSVSENTGEWFEALSRTRPHVRAYSTLLDAQAMELVRLLNTRLIPQKHVIVFVSRSSAMKRVFLRSKRDFRIDLRCLGISWDEHLATVCPQYMLPSWNLRNLYNLLLVKESGVAETASRIRKAVAILRRWDGELKSLKAVRRAAEHDLEEFVPYDLVRELGDAVESFEFATLLAKLDSFMTPELQRLVHTYIDDPVSAVLKNLEDFVTKVAGPGSLALLGEADPMTELASRLKVAWPQVSIGAGLGDISQGKEFLQGPMPIVRELWMLGLIPVDLGVGDQEFRLALDLLRSQRDPSAFRARLASFRKEVLEIKPTPVASAVLAYTYLQIGSESAALAEATEGIRSCDPDSEGGVYAELNWLKSIALGRKRRWKEAMAAIRRALEVAPKESKYVRELSLIHWSGEKEEAVCSLEVAVEVVDDFIAHAGEAFPQTLSDFWLINAAAYYHLRRSRDASDGIDGLKAMRMLQESDPATESWPARWKHTCGMAAILQARSEQDASKRSDLLSQAITLIANAVDELIAVKDVENLAEVQRDLKTAQKLLQSEAK